MSPFAESVLKSEAKVRAARLYDRHLMTYDQLARAFIASGACPSLPRLAVDAARQIVPTEHLTMLEFAPTFEATLELNRSRLDLFELRPAVFQIGVRG